MTPEETIRHVDRVASAIKRSGSMVLPIVHAFTPKGVVLFGLPIDSPEEKGAAYAAARRVLREIGATAYCFVNEAWAIDVGIGPEDRHKRSMLSAGVPVRSVPGRTEVIVYAYADRGGTVLGGQREIMPDGRLGELKIMDQISGRCTNWLE